MTFFGFASEIRLLLAQAERLRSESFRPQPEPVVPTELLSRVLLTPSWHLRTAADVVAVCNGDGLGHLCTLLTRGKVCRGRNDCR